MRHSGGRGPGSRNDGGHRGDGGRGGEGRRGEGPRGGDRRNDAPRDRRDGPRPATPGGPERLSLPSRPDAARAESPRSPQGPRDQGPRDQGPRNHDSRRPHQGGHHGGHHEQRRGDAPKGTLWIYGIHAVAAALANPNRRVRRLVLTEDAEAAIGAQLPQPWPVQAERADRGKLDHLLGRDAVHQGAGLLADPLSPPTLAQALERPGPVLVLDQVTDPRNVGAILRSAAAFGAAAVITQERNAPEETGALAKAASGALEKIPLFRAVNISRTLVALKAAGLWCVGLDAGGGHLSGTALSDRRIALVLGAEGEGLRRLTRETCDEIAGLAVPGGHASVMESLNVSAAASIALYELTRKV